MSQSDDQRRDAPGPYGQEAAGQPQSQPYGQEYPQQQYGQPQPYGQQQYGTPAPTDWNQPAQGASAYGQQQYGYPQQYGQQQYGQPQQYGQYGGSAVPARPGSVTTAAVFGFILGALGVLISLVLFVFGALVAGGGAGLDDEFPGIGGVAGAAGAVLIVFGVLALAWTVVTIWGSVRALSGRSRVMLLVGGSIAIFFTGFGLLSSLGNDETTAGGVIFQLVLFAMAVAIVVLLAMKPAAGFYAAHRARRGR